MWMFVGLGFYVLFTGSLTAQLTAQSSSGTANRYGWADVQNDNRLRVATVAGSASVKQLKAKGVASTLVDFADEEAMYEPLVREKLDIAIADWPVISSDMRRGLISSADYVCHAKTTDDSYGVAFPNNANYHQNLSLAMTKMNAGMIQWDKSTAKDDIYNQYFSRDGESEKDDVHSEGAWVATTIVAFALFIAIFGGGGGGS